VFFTCISVSSQIATQFCWELSGIVEYLFVCLWADCGDRGWLIHETRATWSKLNVCQCWLQLTADYTKSQRLLSCTTWLSNLIRRKYLIPVDISIMLEASTESLSFRRHFYTASDPFLHPVLCTLYHWGDHRSRGQYDNLCSVLGSGHIGPLHKPPLMYAQYVYAWVMCCSRYGTTVTACVKSVGEPAAVCLQYTAWQPVSSSAGLYALCLTALSTP